ncbi:hypothetical protein V7S43_010247 [Phytophthora oleae]|uniref:glucan 1,3-beta-glucosidase n=1 Tax=Phytophthora oleae TaxID=2107226 RepID=A0ABD3FG36_9STRA
MAPVRLAAFATFSLALQNHRITASSEACAASGAYCGNDQTGASCCASGTYCQPWNPSYYQCRPTFPQCGTPEVGVDYYGADLANFAGLKLPEDCCNKCAVTSGCAAFTFINYGWDGQTHCYLKSSTGTKKNVVGAVSAAVSTPSCSTNGGFCGNSKGTTCCPSNSYCQPWNSDYYQCKDVPAQYSTQYTDVDFYGNDMGVTFGGSPWDCCSKCAATAGCVGYTFVKTDSRGPACYLKSNLSGKRVSVGAVSGTMNSPLIANSTLTSTHIQAQIRSDAVKSRAVNLGGWLVSDNWMSWESPLWANVSSDEAWRGEYNVMKVLGKSAGTAGFEAHRKIWITETDIKEIAETGVINTVRVPVGHWIVLDATTSPGSEVEMFAPGGLKYLDSLINVWAVKYNIAVIISLHAHQGSQNGYEHSAPVTIGSVGPAFLGLALMNEPQPLVDRSALQNFYIEAYKQIRATGNKCILLVAPFLSEQDADHLNGMIGAPDYENVWNEIHAYFIWGYDGKSEEQILADVDTYDQSHLKAAPTNNRLFLGEWCMEGPPDQTGIFSNLDNFRKLGEKQLAYYNADTTGGWAFWTWRHSDEIIKRTGWSMRYLIRNGYLKLA